MKKQKTTFKNLTLRVGIIIVSALCISTAIKSSASISGELEAFDRIKYDAFESETSERSETSARMPYFAPMDITPEIAGSPNNPSSTQQRAQGQQATTPHQNVCSTILSNPRESVRSISHRIRRDSLNSHVKTASQSSESQQSTESTNDFIPLERHDALTAHDHHHLARELRESVSTEESQDLNLIDLIQSSSSYSSSSSISRSSSSSSELTPIDRPNPERNPLVAPSQEGQDARTANNNSSSPLPPRTASFNAVVNKRSTITSADMIEIVKQSLIVAIEKEKQEKALEKEQQAPQKKALKKSSGITRWFSCCSADSSDEDND
jgi:hypothetical protein